MTNYKRFISYLYYYESGEKKGNVGFARVETSDEICRITIHCALKAVPKKSCSIYLLKRKTSLLLGKKVGNASLRDGLIDVKLVYDHGAVDEDLSFKECTGIILLYSKDHYIGAKWDESSITYHEAQLIEQIDLMGIIPIQPKKTLVQEEKEKEEPGIYLVPKEEVVVEQIRKVESKHEVEIAEIIEEREPQISTKVEEQQVDHDQVIQEQKKPVVEELKEEKKVEEKQEQKQVQEEKQEQNLEQKQEENQVAAAQAGEAVSVNPWVDHPAARAILNRFVRMYPFDDGEIAECVRLEPKDIGLFPMNYWVLGNNSFLLHSYCTFRHLLFSKKMTREGCEYYLMVPGTFNKRESQLAKMFGFEQFKCSRRRCMKDGEFGYWYVTISFH